MLDPFGYKWSLATHVKDVTVPEMRKAAEVLFAAAGAIAAVVAKCTIVVEKRD